MPRDTLTRDQIVDAAIELLDRDGLEGLNMRALGHRLGSAATAVYWHVGRKDNLDRARRRRVWNGIGLPDPAAAGWRAAAAAMATDLHAMLTRHSWLVQAFGSQVLYGPGKASHDDHGLAVNEAAGFTGSAGRPGRGHRLHLRARPRPRHGRGGLAHQEAEPRRRRRRRPAERPHGRSPRDRRPVPRLRARPARPRPATARSPTPASSSASGPSWTAWRTSSRNHDDALTQDARPGFPARPCGTIVTSRVYQNTNGCRGCCRSS